MALSIHDAFSAGRRRGARSRRGRRPALSEINVTPLVDVMLVLLIIFMISAPLLTVGVPLQLPKTEAGAMQDQSEPLTVSVREDGAIFLNQTQVPFASLSPALVDMAGKGFSRRLRRYIQVISLMISRALPGHCLNAGAGAWARPGAALPGASGPTETGAELVATTRRSW